MIPPHRPEIPVGDVARLFDGRRLRLARQLAGLRKNALAERIGRTPTAVAAYEKNAKRPAPGTVAQLSLALGVDPGFFLPGPLDLEFGDTVPHFRSLRSTTQLARDQALAYGLATVDVAFTLERHVEFPDRDIPHIDLDIDEEFTDAPEEAARLLRSHWDISDGPVGHLIRAAENRGVIIVFSPPQVAAVDAHSFDSRTRPVVILNPTKNDYYRQRFDVAHELGHLVMHTDAEPGSKTVEDQANRFAAEFLLPAKEMCDLLPDRADWRRLAILKEAWGVSMQALLFRSRSLGIMGDVAYRNSMSYLSARGWRRQEPGIMPVLEQPSLLPGSVNLLNETGVNQLDLARESRVPLSLFQTVTSRVPLFEVVEAADADNELEEELPDGVVSIFTSAR